MPVPVFSAGEVLTASAMNQVGLYKVGSGTLSLTTTPTNVTGVFDNTKFKNYRVLFNVTARATAGSFFQMKYIVGTTPTSSGYFQAALGCDWSADTVVYLQRSANSAQFNFDATNGLSSCVMDIFNANKAVETLHTIQLSQRTTAAAYSGGGVNTAATAFTGFQLFTNTSTMTVEYQVFGYRD